MTLFQNEQLRRVKIATANITFKQEDIDFGGEVRIFEDEGLHRLWVEARTYRQYQDLTLTVVGGSTTSLPHYRWRRLSVWQSSLLMNGDNYGLGTGFGSHP